MARFEKGTPKPPNSGRKKGVANKVTGDIKKMILGALDAEGGQAYFELQARRNPNAFLALVGKLIPKDIKIDANVTLEELLLQTMNRPRPKKSKDDPKSE